MAVFRELQRRKVIRVAGVYLVIAWLLLQVSATITPILGLPDWFDRLVLALLGIGFPVALILAWAFELTPEGLRADSGSPPRRGSAVVVDYAILLVVLGAIAYVLIDRSDPGDSVTAQPGTGSAGDASLCHPGRGDEG